MQQTKARLFRKLIHLLTGLMILALTYLLEKDMLLLIMIVGSLFSILTFNFRSFSRLHKTPDTSLGTLFYPLGIVSAFLILYTYPDYMFRITLMVLTLADPMANLVGQIKSGNGRFMIWRDKKSILGLLAFAATASVVFQVFLPGGIVDNLSFVVLALILSVAFEVISFRGSDNFSIPLGLAVFFVLSEAYELPLLFLSGLLLLMTLGSYLLFKWGVLTRYGSLLAWALGLYFFGVLGYRWMLPVLFFFVSSVIFTRIHSAVANKDSVSGPRNGWQVLANILWALISTIGYLVIGDVLFIYFFIVLIAAVTADTWASELGPVFNRRSLSLSDLRMHRAGVTGGISFFGTFFALLGSLMVSVLSYGVFFGRVPGLGNGLEGISHDVNSVAMHGALYSGLQMLSVDVMLIVMLTVSGFFACFADTLLGAFVEDRLLAMPYFSNRQSSGFISPNDVVNLAGSATAPLFFLFFYWMVSLRGGI